MTLRARVAEEQPLRPDGRPLALGPGLRHERVEGVHPAALDANVVDTVEEEPAAVAVAAVARGPRDRKPPELLAAAEGERTDGRDTRVVQLVRVSPARSGDHDVRVVRPRRRRVPEDRGAALDDVVEPVGPEHLAGRGVDLAQLVPVGGGDDVGPPLVHDDAGLSGPAAAGPPARRVVLVFARAPAAAELDLPEDVETPRRRPLPVVAASVVAQEGADLDAVARHRRRGRRRHRPDRPAPLSPVSRTAGGDAPDDERQHGAEDEERDAAPATHLTSALC